MATPATNLLLQSLSSESRQAIQTHAVAIPMPYDMGLYEAMQPTETVYFPTSGMASIVAAMGEGSAAEVGMVGREGLIGGMHLMGPTTPSTKCMMQVGGSGLRVPMGAMRRLFRSSDEIRERVMEFSQVQSLGLAQVSGCNRLHDSEERLARWLLMAQDRVGGDVLELTQQFLAEMLGARRTTVTLIAGTMQRAGLIQHERGSVRVLDRARLEQAACECYRIVRDQVNSLYQQPAGRA